MSRVPELAWAFHRLFIAWIVLTGISFTWIWSRRNKEPDARREQSLKEMGFR